MEAADLQFGTWCLLDGQKARVYRTEQFGNFHFQVYVETFPAGLPRRPNSPEEDLAERRLRKRHGPLLPEDLEPYQPPDYDEWLAHQKDERRALLPN